MAKSRSIHPTLYEVMQNVAALGSTTRAKRNSVTDLKPKTFPHREGLQTLTPEQLLTIRIPVQKVQSGTIKGYQRHLVISHAREMARWLLDNPNYMKEMPAIEVSIDGDGNAFYTDGQHRGASGVLAYMPMKVIVTKRSETEARRLFALQAKARRPSRTTLIFDGDGPYEEYIQDAVTDRNHPWNAIISSSEKPGGGTSRISATSAHVMLRTFVGRSSHHQRTTGVAEARFEKQAADQLAVLLSCFGTRQSNPLAFNASALKAIAAAARYVFRERDPHPGDVDRWIRHMSRFPFQQYAYLRGQRDLTEKLIWWWNKHLPEDRKVRIPS